MPYWTKLEEERLRELVEEGKSIEELSQVFKRSAEAVRLKLRGLGLAIPQSLKEVGSTSTPQEALAPLKATEDLISAEEAMRMWLGCIKRLNEPGLTSFELKRIRLILSALKSYIIVYADYVERIKEIEERLSKLTDLLIAHTEEKRDKAESEEERAKWQQKLDEMKAKKAEEDKTFTIWARRCSLPAHIRGRLNIRV